MDWNESRWNRGASFGFGAEEDIERGGNYAYGSPYGQGDMGSDRPRSGRGAAPSAPDDVVRGRTRFFLPVWPCRGLPEPAAS